MIAALPLMDTPHLLAAMEAEGNLTPREEELIKRLRAARRDTTFQKIAVYCKTAPKQSAEIEDFVEGLQQILEGGKND